MQMISDDLIFVYLRYYGVTCKLSIVKCQLLSVNVYVLVFFKPKSSPLYRSHHRVWSSDREFLLSVGACWGHFGATAQNRNIKNSLDGQSFVFSITGVNFFHKNFLWETIKRESGSGGQWSEILLWFHFFSHSVGSLDGERKERFQESQSRFESWSERFDYLYVSIESPLEYLGAPKDPFSGGVLGAPKYSWGPPRALMRCLTSIATLTSCLVQPPVQLG